MVKKMVKKSQQIISENFRQTKIKSYQENDKELTKRKEELVIIHCRKNWVLLIKSH